MNRVGVSLLSRVSMRGVAVSGISTTSIASSSVATAVVVAQRSLHSGAPRRTFSPYSSLSSSSSTLLNSYPKQIQHVFVRSFASCTYLS
jgi:hypothetical protein